MKLGRFELDNIYNEDCYKAIKDIPDKSIDCIYTDPPYEFHSGIGKSGIFKNRKVVPHANIQNTILTEGINASILDEFVRVLKRINIFIWCNKEQIPNYLNYFATKNCTFEILTWHKTNPTPLTKNTWLPDTEYCLYFKEYGLPLNDGYELKSKYDISDTNKGDKDKFCHPTIKPLNIAERHISHVTQANDIVLDTFLGSGTTAVAAKNLGRHYIGFEINEEYYKIAKNRLNNVDANGQMSLFTM